jgi:hypothetical protein
VVPPCARQALAGLIVAAALLLTACGSGGDPPRPSEQQRLTAPERAAVDSGRAAIRAYCRRLGLHLAGRGGAPSDAVRDRALVGAREIASVARRKPGAPYEQGIAVRTLAADIAEDLEGTNCSPALVVELRRGL